MKIIIVGPPGAGKTTLSNKLGLALGIGRVYELDRFFWKPGWKMTSLQERLTILESLTVDDSWVIEGNYTNTLDFQFAKADAAVLLNIPIHICLWRLTLQHLGYLFHEPPEIAPGCKDRFSINLLKSILMYYPVDNNIITKVIKSHENVKLIRIFNQRQIDTFLEHPNMLG